MINDIYSSQLKNRAVPKGTAKSINSNFSTHSMPLMGRIACNNKHSRNFTEDYRRFALKGENLSVDNLETIIH